MSRRRCASTAHSQAVDGMIQTFGARLVLEGVADYCSAHLGFDVFSPRFDAAADMLKRDEAPLFETEEEEEKEAAVAPPPPAAPAAKPPVNADVAYTLSPSQLNCYLDCAARWYYKYTLRIPDPSNASRALGRAVHAAIAENFRQKLESKQDLGAAAGVALFLTAWAEASDETVWTEQDNRADLEDTGKMAVAMYLDQVAPRIEPAAVEHAVTGEIAGVNVQGRIDVLDIEGRIIDVKTAAKKPGGIRPDYRLQVATYALLEPTLASGAARVDTIVKTRTLAIFEHSFAVEACDVKSATVLYPLAQEGMRSGLYTPNRNSFLCSRRYCPYWSQCEDEYGGQVSER